MFEEKREKPMVEDPTITVEDVYYISKVLSELLRDNISTMRVFSTVFGKHNRECGDNSLHY